MPAVLWLISNNFINRHYHILSNGVVISHSHPYSSSCEPGPIQGHEHSDFEHLILAQVSANSNTECAEGLFVEFFSKHEIKSYPDYKPGIIESDLSYLPDLRAPPKKIF